MNLRPGQAALGGGALAGLLGAVAGIQEGLPFAGIIFGTLLLVVIGAIIAFIAASLVSRE